LIVLKKPENLPDGIVACKVCLKEIPRSVASSQEGLDYVLFFCGDNCFVEWQKGTKETDKFDTQPGQ
jgi:hypothetical protein